MNLLEIKSRLAAATPGPWKFYPADDNDDWTIHNIEFTFVKQEDSGVPVSRADGDFIANSITDIAYLISELERAQEDLTMLRNLYDSAVAKMKSSDSKTRLAQKGCENLVKATQDALKYYSKTNQCELNCDPSVGFHTPECCIETDLQNALYDLAPPTQGVNQEDTEGE